MGKKIAMVAITLILVIAVASGTALWIHRESTPATTTVENGMAAYELAVQYRYNGTSQDWPEELPEKSEPGRNQRCNV